MDFPFCVSFVHPFVLLADSLAFEESWISMDFLRYFTSLQTKTNWPHHWCLHAFYHCSLAGPFLLQEDGSLNKQQPSHLDFFGGQRAGEADTLPTRVIYPFSG